MYVEISLNENTSHLGILKSSKKAVLNFFETASCFSITRKIIQTSLNISKKQIIKLNLF